MSRNTRNKPNTATQPVEDTDFDGYGSPAYLKWIEENDEYLARQLDKDNPANIAALEIMRTLFGGKNEHQSGFGRGNRSPDPAWQSQHEYS